MPAPDRNAAGVRGRADGANQLSDTRCCVLNTGGCGTQSEFSKSPPLACWYLPREDEGRPNAGGHSAEGPTPQIPRGGGDVGVSTLALEFAGGRLDRHTKVTLSSAPAASSAPSSASARGLDWFTFFLADIQTGFGPFVAIYLTAHAWPQFDIGLVLTAGGLVALACQLPGRPLIDAFGSARLVAALAVGAICVSALALALWPTFPVVMATRVLHAGASCVLGPVIAAISLGLVGHAALGERFGRNARFASIGNAGATAAMGAC